MMPYTKYQDSRSCGFRHEDFSRFPYISLCKTFEPRGYILNIKTLGLVVSDMKIFSRFPYISLCKTFEPRGGVIFGPSGMI